MYSDTSKYATGSALYQIQNGKPKLIAYVSKRLPEATKNYSIMELEMCGLAINITSFAHLLKRADFDAVVDYLVLVHIPKRKTEPTTTRIKRLLEVLSAYSFNLYYMKGKDMILSNFLSRQRIDEGNPHKIIPISFDMKAILKDKYYNVGNETKYLVQTCTQVKDKGIKLPEVHGVNKGVDPYQKPEWIVRKPQKIIEKSRLEHDRECPSGDTPVQEQMQVTEESNIREQLIQKQKEGISTPQVSQNPNRSIEHDKDTIPKYVNRP